VRHGTGYTVFEHNSHGLRQRVSLFAARDAPVKIVRLQLENTWNRPRRITATYYAEWALGPSRELASPTLVPSYRAESRALFARNPFMAEYSEAVSFLAAGKELHGLTADRTEFLGRLGNLHQPAALSRIGLNSRVWAGLDPCAALQLHVNLAPGGSEEVVFLVGQGRDEEHALECIRRYGKENQVAAAWEENGRFWDELCDMVSVSTPDEALNLLLNRWLIYQTLSCRIWARSALYQSSGAYGFRDQLQDVTALVHARPGIAREHLVRAAGCQFEEGDVLHWWHPPSNRGVRTRISDDLAWLPFVAAHYVGATGDVSVLEEIVPFLNGKALEKGENEHYGQFESGVERASFYEHCCRALDRAATTGNHGLALMGAGDWNDSMNRLGVEGRGESIWLSWFLARALSDFAGICEDRGDRQRAAAYRQKAEAYRQAIELHGWDGQWYLRAFTDQGTVLGSAQNEECQIDAIAQSWAVLSGLGDSRRSKTAMNAVRQRLIDQDDRLILLLAPPFDHTRLNPGYIEAYPPGIRENGGQYTHAASWTIWAYAAIGEGDMATCLYQMINPILRADSREKAERYGVEPYVFSGDVYGPPREGQGGWTWYTGSSAWLYRLGVERILGLQRSGSTLRFEPRIPLSWPEYRMSYKYGDAHYDIVVKNPYGVSQGINGVTLDGESAVGGEIPLHNDSRRHKVVVTLGPGGQ
jgi:cyclic beta-1,2-glucan synthetase